MARTCVMALSIGLSVMAPVASAQPIQSPVLGGVPVSCTSPTGQPVLSFVQPTNDIARASVLNGTPIIILNPQVANLPPPVQWFVYGHECMHHRLGHVLGNMSLSMEVDADCQSAKLLRSQGLLNGQTIGLVAAYYQNNPGLPPLYPPGPQRVANILACFNGS
jgi:hypothetical protein